MLFVVVAMIESPFIFIVGELVSKFSRIKQVFDLMFILLNAFRTSSLQWVYIVEHVQGGVFFIFHHFFMGVVQALSNLFASK